MQVTGICRHAGMAIIAFLFSASVVLAERRPADISVNVGFDGIAGRSGSLFPVTITINNKIAGTSGTIDLCQPDGGGKYEVMQSLSFDTPAPSVKRFVMLVRREKRRELEVRINFRDYLEPFSVKTDLAGEDRALILTVGVPLSYRSGAIGDKYKFAGIPRTQFPVDPLALDGVHAVMFSGQEFSALDRSQRDALRKWVTTGGVLVMFDPTEDTIFGSENTQASVHLFRKGVYSCDSGLIASTGADPDPKNAFWGDDKAIMHQLFPDTIDKEESQSFRVSSALERLWRTQKSYGAQGWIWVLLIIVGYILVIGPIDRRIVLRMGKPYLTWVLFPIAIAVFSFIAYGYSRLVNVGTMRAVYVNMLDVSPAAGVARGNTMMWIYSARNATYRIRTPVENVCFSGRESDMGAGRVAGVDVFNGRESSIEARIPVFSAKRFDASWYAPWEHRITMKQQDALPRVSVPPELKVIAGYIAQKDGLVTLTKTETDWVGNSLLPWQDVLMNVGKSLLPNYSRSKDDESLMPVQEALQNYLVAMSFPVTVEDVRTEQQGGNAPSMNSGGPEFVSFLDDRDEKERAANISSRLGTGRVLLLFLAPESSILPVSMGLARPVTAQVNLVRIHGSGLGDNVK